MSSSSITRLPDVDLPKAERRSSSVLGIGVTGIVLAIDDETVVKEATPSDCAYSDNEALHDIWTERTIYRRLGHHPRICRYIRDVDRGIVLERLCCSLRKHLVLLQRDGGRVPPDQALKWSIQAAEAIAYIHTKLVVQADIGCYNFLLDGSGDIKLYDFGGSSIDGSEPRVGYGTRSQLWREPGDNANTSSIPCELFALGSTIYEIWTTLQPYHDLNDEEVENRYKHQQFPDLRNLPVAEIIQKCWLQKYTSASEVVRDLEQIQEPLASLHNATLNPPTTETKVDPKFPALTPAGSRYSCCYRWSCGTGKPIPLKDAHSVSRYWG